MLLQRYQQSVKPTKLTAVKSSPKRTSRGKPIAIDAQVKLRNFRKSLSIGTVVSHLSDADAPTNKKGQYLNWGVRMKSNGYVIHVNAHEILKVL